MFATALHSGVLGALLTFTQKLWYPTYSQTTSPWGLSPMEDQQLGGLIMWVPAGLVYIAAGLALFAGWLAESEQRGYKFENKRSPSPAGAVSLLLCLMIPLLTGCGDSQTMKEVKIMTHGDPVVGKQTIKQAGCTACHTIPGIRDAHASVGPPLNQIANRTYIGGVLKNTPDNMIKWLLNPPAHAPKTAMPDLHLTEAQARDVAAYLYTLK